MKHTVLCLMSLCTLWVSACQSEPENPFRDSNKLTPPEETLPDSPTDSLPPTDIRIRMIFDDHILNATLEDNPCTQAFLKLLPLQVRMDDLNHHEKYTYLAKALPSMPTRPKTIHTGDLMLFGSDCLVLFYQTFSSSYSYSRIGRVDFPENLATILGKGSIHVRIEQIDQP